MTSGWLLSRKNASTSSGVIARRMSRSVIGPTRYLIWALFRAVGVRRPVDARLPVMRARFVNARFVIPRAKIGRIVEARVFTPPYERRSLFARWGIELMLSRWYADAASAAHDHGGGRGLVVVLWGDAREQRRRPTPFRQSFSPRSQVCHRRRSDGCVGRERGAITASFRTSRDRPRRGASDIPWAARHRVPGPPRWPRRARAPRRSRSRVRRRGPPRRRNGRTRGRSR